MKISGIDFMNLRIKSSYLIGIDIGTDALKMAGVRMAGRPSLEFYSITALPKDIDDAGITEMIRKVLAEKNVSSKEAAVLCLGDDEVAIRRIELPAMAHDEIAGALRWQAADMVQFDMPGALLDFKVLREREREGSGKVFDILFLAASKEVIDKKMKILKDNSLEVISINASPFGIEKMIKLDEEAVSQKTIMAVDLGHAKTIISILHNGVLEFVRTVHMGSRDITKAIAEGNVITESGNISYSAEEAERLKRDLGVSYETVILKNGATSTQVLSFMRPVLEHLSKEIKRSLDYYMQEYDGDNLSAIYLTGGGSLLKNLDRFLNEEFGVTIRRLGMTKAIDTQKAAVKDDDAPRLISLFGTMLGYKERPNLVPHEYTAKKTELIQAASLRMAAVAAALVLLVLFIFIKLRMDNYNYRVKNIEFQKSVLGQIKELSDKVAKREDIMARAKASSLPLEKIMKEISNLIPNNVVLDSLSVDSRSDTVNMRGVVYEQRGRAEAVLTKFMENMEQARFFKDAQLSLIQSGGESGKDDVSNFEINCSLE